MNIGDRLKLHDIDSARRKKREKRKRLDEEIEILDKREADFLKRVQTKYPTLFAVCKQRSTGLDTLVGLDLECSDVDGTHPMFTTRAKAARFATMAKAQPYTDGFFFELEQVPADEYLTVHNLVMLDVGCYDEFCPRF
jgi:hypothetical protein